MDFVNQTSLQPDARRDVHGATAAYYARHAGIGYDFLRSADRDRWGRSHGRPWPPGKHLLLCSTREPTGFGKHSFLGGLWSIMAKMLGCKPPIGVWHIVWHLHSPLKWMAIHWGIPHPEKIYGAKMVIQYIPSFCTGHNWGGDNRMGCEPICNCNDLYEPCS